MSVFGKVKQFFGVGTVKVKLEADPRLNLSQKELKGKVHLTAKSNQEVQGVTIELKEEWTKGEGENKTTKTFIIGKQVFDKPFGLIAGEEKTLDFSLDLKFLRNADDFKEITGFFETISAAKTALHEESDFILCATCDVSGAAFDPNDCMTMEHKS